MKKFLLLIVLLTAFASSQAQTNRFPSVDSLKTYILKYIRNSTLEAFTNYRMQNVVYGTAELLDSLTASLTNGAVDSIWITSSVSKDSIKYRKSGVVRRYFDNRLSKVERQQKKEEDEVEKTQKENIALHNLVDKLTSKVSHLEKELALTNFKLQTLLAISAIVCNLLQM